MSNCNVMKLFSCYGNIKHNSGHLIRSMQTENENNPNGTIHGWIRSVRKSVVFDKTVAQKENPFKKLQHKKCKYEASKKMIP